MGLFGDIAGAVVVTYKANTKEAEAAIRKLSGVQKKEAKEAAEAYKAQGEAFERNVAQFAKGAAIIAGALLVANSGIKAMREESRLTAGAAGVDIGRLSDSFGGLKTRMEVLTIAQAGHQGAWKLTTAQLQLVADGMRALEKKGYDAQQVFDKFTDVLKKGKTEGLDDFGLSIKSTGDQTKDLQVLMQALGKEVADVGGNFDKAGDDAQRAMVKMEDGIGRLRVAVGKASSAFLDLGVAIGDGLGKLVYGDLPVDPGVASRGAVLGERFARVSHGLPLTGNVSGLKVSDADAAAGRTLSTFKSSVNKAMQNWGPLASATPQDFADLVAGLPKDWRLVDAELAKNVDALGIKLQDKLKDTVTKAVGTAYESFGAAWRTEGERYRNKQAAASARAAGKGPQFFDRLMEGPKGMARARGWLSGIAGGAEDIVDALAAQQAEQDAKASAAFASDRDAYNAQMTQRFNDAQTVQDLAAFEQNFAKEQEQSFLERTFGKLEEFDAYAAGFSTLKGAVQDGFAAWISGSESLGTAIKKSIAQSLAAYAVEMSGKALVAGAEALFFLAKGNFAGAAAMGWSAAKYAAAAGTLGYMAKELGGGSSAGGGVAASAAGVGSRPSASGPTGQSGIVIVGDPLSDDSPRERARRVRRAMRSAGRDAEGVTHG